MKTTSLQAINYTNARLENWYKTAKEDYNVNGSAFATVENETLIINYTEDGVNGVFEVPYFQYEAKDYAFNVWAEMADLEEDRVN